MKYQKQGGLNIAGVCFFHNSEISIQAGQVASEACFLCLSLAGFVLPVCSCGSVCVCILISSSYKDTSHSGVYWRRVPLTDLSLISLFKYLSHMAILRYWFRTSTYEFGEHKFVHHKFWNILNCLGLDNDVEVLKEHSPWSFFHFVFPTRF